MGDFGDERTRLFEARAAHRPGSTVPHTVVALPSYSVGRSQLSHYAHRLPALEHRQLLPVLRLAHIPGAHLVFLTCLEPARQVLDYYLDLLPADQRDGVRSRLTLLHLGDTGPRSVTHKILDRSDVVEEIRARTHGRLAFVDPWNVTGTERELADRVGLPLNGTPHELWPLGFKSSGRRLMRAAGVPLPPGREDVRTVEDVVATAESVRRHHPDAAGVVVKCDESSTGDGNRVLLFSDLPDRALLRAAVSALEPWYLRDLLSGGVVEQLMVGSAFASPSVQGDIAPDGQVTVVSTHEQLLGGTNNQVYLGCRFPADPAYRHALVQHGAAVGKVLADRGALGRFAVDFVAVRSAAGEWDVLGLEINLRTSGTSHAFSVLQNLVLGRYDDATGRWIARDGTERCYRSTDNLVDPRLHGRPPDEVIDVIRAAGLELDTDTRTGVVLHMLSGLDIDGRLGLTAVGRSPQHADNLYQAAVAALSQGPEQARGED